VRTKPSPDAQQEAHWKLPRRVRDLLIVRPQVDDRSSKEWNVLFADAELPLYCGQITIVLHCTHTHRSRNPHPYASFSPDISFQLFLLKFLFLRHPLMVCVRGLGRAGKSCILSPCRPLFLIPDGMTTTSDSSVVRNLMSCQDH
jgi:hypothetical protein